MAGSNPYHEAAQYTLPEKPYTLKVILEDGSEKEISVDPAKIPYDHNGLPGSVLDILLGSGVEVDHACGGVTACSTCHVYVEDGADSCNEAAESEEDMLDHARGLRDSSRLSCQCVPNGTATVTVRIPGWNRNLARESH